MWAPHADTVSVIGSFNDWDSDAHPMEAEEGGYWFADIPEAEIGDEYKFQLRNGNQSLERIDPYARKVTSSVGNAIVHDPVFDWSGDDYELPPWNELVIYEMHVGTFGRQPGDHGNSDFDGIESQFDHLSRLGINVIQLMPIGEFGGVVSWGYNPSQIFAVESDYGGPVELKEFISLAHRRGFGIVLDVVYNHFGPSDLELWQFDGWSSNGKGGIYFYNDWRSATPWGDTRPDYGRNEVRQYIRDNVQMWRHEYHVDGLRFDMTQFIRTVDGSDSTEIPDGWSLMQWINEELSEQDPNFLAIAEDLQNNEYLTKPPEEGGAGFGSQWDARFVHPIRELLQAPRDEQRSMVSLQQALEHGYNERAFQRVVYTESHDEVANGKARVTEEIDPENVDNWFAQKRSTLGAALVLTAPGIPMLFQGQEFLQGDWFDDQAPLDWEQAEEYGGIVRLYRDLVRLRRNIDGETKGLTGQLLNVHHVNDVDKLIAFHRWNKGGPGDDVIVVLNFANRAWETYEIGLPRAGIWRLRLNSDWSGYSDGFGNYSSTDITAPPNRRDGYPATGSLSIGAYSALIYSQHRT
ncbi:MAG: alpha amylase C-terminal domain-containing protein [Planctomycetaceae bacterium]|nr:alpha amylase C-terminal domain-containing protein [Planctomycetaceae bacterium]